MVSVLASSGVDLSSSPSRVKQVFKIGINCFSVKHAALKSKTKDWLARNQDNVSEWSDMSTHRLLKPTKRVVLVQSRPHLVEK